MKANAGNFIVGQSGGPTAVINSSLAGVYRTAMDRNANKVYGMLYGIQGLLEEKYVDLSEHIKTKLDVELLKRTPSSFLGSCRYKLPERSEKPELYERIFEILNKLEITCFFYIGGNDSMDTIKKLYDYAQEIHSEILFIGVPKTIDNDLAVTDHTPGFGSAAKYIASVTKELIRDSLVYDTKSITIIEVMGRNAGWLTGACALARTEDCEGPDLIYLPEVVFEYDKCAAKIRKLQETKKSIIIAVSEGIRDEEGRYICEMTSSVAHVDSFGHRTLTGAASYLANRLAAELNCKTRAIEINTLQRCASHLSSRVDMTEAFQVGGAAVREALRGKSGLMITLKRITSEPYVCITDSYDVHEIANLEKKVPRAWIHEDADYITDEFLHYVKPLVQAELTPIMTEGLPGHLVLNKNLL